MDNPYLDAYRAAAAHQAVNDPRSLVDGRPWLCCMCDTCRGLARSQSFTGPRTRYAWAVPNDTALDTIAAHSPGGVLELGAGAGFWAMLLRARGVDVLAFDPDPAGTVGWHNGHRWTGVGWGDHTAAAEHPGRTLLLCWPLRAWASEAVALYRGATVVYVGQDDDRPDQLGDPVHTVDIPRWAGATDRLEVHRR